MSLGGPDSIGGAPARDLILMLDQAMVLAINERTYPEESGGFSRDAARALMDPLDTGKEKIPKAWKDAVSYSAYPKLQPERWAGKGFPERVMELIRTGAVFEPCDPPEVQGISEGERVDPNSEEPLGAGRYCDQWGRVHQFKVEDGQYDYPDREHFERGAAECDRAMLVGHLEPVPAHLVNDALAKAPAHPWTIVHQSIRVRLAARRHREFALYEAISG